MPWADGAAARVAALIPMQARSPLLPSWGRGSGRAALCRVRLFPGGLSDALRLSSPDEEPTVCKGGDHKVDTLRTSGRTTPVSSADVASVLACALAPCAVVGPVSHAALVEVAARRRVVVTAVSQVLLPVAVAVGTGYAASVLAGVGDRWAIAAGLLSAAATFLPISSVAARWLRLLLRDLAEAASAVLGITSSLFPTGRAR